MPWQPKDDAPSVVVLDSGLISVLLAAWPSLIYLAPALAGEVLQVDAFCAAGPVDPPITLADVVWVGFPPNDGRPHTLLTVTRAIARAEAFAQYCEQPGAGSKAWYPYDVDACGTGPDVWDCVIYSGISPLPTWAEQVRTHIDSGGGARIALSVAQANRMTEAVGRDQTPNSSITASGYGAGVFVGQDEVLNVLPYSPTTTLLYPFLIRREGTPPAIAPYCATIEYYGLFPGGDYVPPESDEDPDVVLPDGEGATLDQLEVKLDMIQQQLRQTGVGNFALDPTSMSGVNDLVEGELLDAVGILVLITNRPSTRTSWSSDPPRFPQLATLTFGNSDGWWPALEVEHVESIYLPLPTGASRYSVQCQEPMLASVTLYRPVMGPASP